MKIVKKKKKSSAKPLFTPLEINESVFFYELRQGNDGAEAFCEAITIDLIMLFFFCKFMQKRLKEDNWKCGNTLD